MSYFGFLVAWNWVLRNLPVRLSAHLTRLGPAINGSAEKIKCNLVKQLVEFYLKVHICVCVKFPMKRSR